MRAISSKLCGLSVGSKLIKSSVTSYMSQHNMTASQVVAQLRAEVEAKTKLTMSAGIAPNRMLAKVGSTARDTWHY